MKHFVEIQGNSPRRPQGGSHAVNANSRKKSLLPQTYYPDDNPRSMVHFETFHRERSDRPGFLETTALLLRDSGTVLGGEQLINMTCLSSETKRLALHLPSPVAGQGKRGSRARPGQSLLELRQGREGQGLAREGVRAARGELFHCV
jgi:hypothetical protein